MSAEAVPRLFDAPLAGLYPISMHEANDLLAHFGHKLGRVNRPFRQEGYALELDGRPVGVVCSGSIVNGPVCVMKDEDGTVIDPGYQRDEVVELTRLAGEPWASRLLIRLWREVCAPRWACWPVKAAVSYSHNAMHSGNLYRFDGWEKIWPRRVYQGWKPILWYSKGDTKLPRHWIEDRIVSRPDKRFHHWGQDLNVFCSLVDAFTEFDELVCDPFLGGGTTGVAALLSRRRFVGCDVDEDCITKTRARLDGVADYMAGQPAITGAFK